MNILLTGAAGFIAARVAEALLDEGHFVLGLDNLNDYYDVRLKRFRLARLLQRENFVFEEVDIEDQPALESRCSKYRFDAIINLAARAGVRASIDEPRVYIGTNISGSLNLLQYAVQRDIDRFIMASTSSLYAGASSPFRESENVTRPISPYAASKLGAEALAHAWHHLYGIHVTILRYFTVYGPAGRPDMSLFRFIERGRRKFPITIFGDGTQTRDFTYVDDIARGTAMALRQDGFEVFNLGGGKTPISINTVIATIEELLGQKLILDYREMHAADMRATAANIERAAEVLGWTPEVPLKEGLSRTVAWHVENALLLQGICV